MAAARGEAQPIGEAERDHHRVELVEAVRAAADHGERQVQLRRREPDAPASRRRDGSVAAVTSATLATVRDAPIGPSASRRASHSATAERLRAPVGVDAGRREGRASSLGGIDRQLAREHVVEHLAALAEARLDEAPELVLAIGGEAASASRLHDETAESTFGAGSNASGGTGARSGRAAWYCTNTER